MLTVVTKERNTYSSQSHEFEQVRKAGVKLGRTLCDLDFINEDVFDRMVKEYAEDVCDAFGGSDPIYPEKKSAYDLLVEFAHYEWDTAHGDLGKARDHVRNARSCKA